MSSGFEKVKIVATLGADASPKTIGRLAELGVDVFRYSMSHGDPDKLKSIVRAIRQAETRLNKPLAALGDLMGPKIRIGSVDLGSTVAHNSRLRIIGSAIRGNQEAISLNLPSILKFIKPGAEVFLGDGEIKLVVEIVSANEVVTRVLVGGELRSRMGFSCHGLTVKKTTLQSKDRQDIKLLTAAGFDMIAVSFVQTEKDINNVIKLLPRTKRPLVIAKIETEMAVRNAEKILDLADGLMVARGDLGFSVPMPEIPFIQADLINLGLRMAKPVITATQMLESMVSSHLPTRAEVADVSKAVLDGTDAVMLSGETAYGKYPEEAVKTMVKIIKTSAPRVSQHDFLEGGGATEAVGASVVKIANQIQARLIIALTTTGATARSISRHRPTQPILALCPDAQARRNLTLTWGVRSMHCPLTHDLEACLDLARRAARNNHLLKLNRGDFFVLSAGVPFGKSGTTNLVLIQKV